MELSLTLKGLLDRALASAFGVVVKLPTPYDARYNRRRLYAERERLRTLGHDEYDILSVIVRDEKNLLIIRRDKIPSGDSVGTAACRSLSPTELPSKIASRGKSRVGVCNT